MPEVLPGLEAGVVWIDARRGLRECRHGDKSLPCDIGCTERDEPDD
jgi:hypothetical protein